MKRVIVGFSGGIDSFFLSYLLKSEGFEIIPVYFRLFKDADVEKVVKKANLLGLRLKVLDLTSQFERIVIRSFVEYYKKGLTPNPCAVCNREIKIRYLEIVRREEGADFIATGHYAKCNYHLRWKRRLIERGRDRKKEQSYFLSVVRLEDLQHLILPLGNYTKEEVERKVNDLGITWEDGESQDICFVKRDYREFLMGFLPPRPGNFVLTDGRKVGRYEYPYFYTVGQRKGLGISYKHPLYVLELLPHKGKVVVGGEEFLHKEEIYVKNVEWHLSPKEVGSFNGISVQIRYRTLPVNIEKIEYLKNGIYCVKLRGKVKAPAPGQVCAFYCGNLLLGGGEITQRKPEE